MSEVTSIPIEVRQILMRREPQSEEQLGERFGLLTFAAVLSEVGMADDKAIRGPADRLRINVNEEYEVRYWTRELSISEERLRALVAKHGVMVSDIRRALGK